MQSRLPTEPGCYFWDEWNRNVSIVLLGKTLIVRCSEFGQPDVKLSNKIAGTFTKVEKDKL